MTRGWAEFQHVTEYGIVVDEEKSDGLRLTCVGCGTTIFLRWLDPGSHVDVEPALDWHASRRGRAWCPDCWRW